MEDFDKDMLNYIREGMNEKYNSVSQELSLAYDELEDMYDGVNEGYYSYDDINEQKKYICDLEQEWNDLQEALNI